MKVGFIGLGQMGNRMAHNIGKAGHEVAMYDVRPEAVAELAARTPGGRAANSVSDAASGADIVCTSLPGPADVESVVLGPGGLKETMAAGGLFIDLSTNSPTVVRKLAKSLAERNIAMLDAPVSGGIRGAEGATLSVMVGGDKATFDRAQAVLSAIGTKVFHCGDIGNGTVVKLCNNLAALGYGVFLGEVLTLGVKSGVDLKTLASVMAVSSGRSPKLTNGFPGTVFKRKFEGFGFSVALSAKDARLAVELAKDMGVQLDMGAAVARDFQEATALGLGALDFDAVVQVQEKRTGVTLQMSEEDIAALQQAVAG